MRSASCSQADKARRFQALHVGADGFIIPNPWDVGSARLLSQLGFEALATTSAGFAFSRGKPDHAVARDALLGHLAELCTATDLPVSADLGNGFGDAPQEVAVSIRLAADAGVVGASIEDTTGRPDDPVHALPFAVERIRAAVAQARALPFPFVVTARADNYFVGRSDLANTIARLQAYQDAGADVLFAPGLTGQGDIATVVRSVDRPVNVLIGVPGLTLGARELAQLGVRRISVGGSLARAAYGELLRAASELRDQGTASYALQAVGGSELNRRFAG
ncbi:isocitrate lyase/PEP mutase family protein [Methylibium sp.]|uniref:isocitrate lyase/PEP mutase family protein n=1 Tax=Methylibium sp. TaxID=2067992 RepID=UPI003D0E0BA6